jgi:hypothetical protein
MRRSAAGHVEAPLVPVSARSGAVSGRIGSVANRQAWFGAHRSIEARARAMLSEIANRGE